MKDFSRLCRLGHTRSVQLHCRENGQCDEELDAGAVGGLFLQLAQILHVDARVGQAGNRLVAFR